MLQALPYILEPVPNDLVNVEPAGWSIDFDDIHNAELLGNTQIEAIIDASSDRSIDTGYLRFGPVRWWRTLEPVDTVNVDSRFPVDPDGEVACTAPPSGRTSVTTDEFVSAVTNFDHHLLEAMQLRVDRIAANGVPPAIDVDGQTTTWRTFLLESQPSSTDYRSGPGWFESGAS